MTLLPRLGSRYSETGAMVPELAKLLRLKLKLSPDEK
jgi:hypothetical protein